MSRLEFRKPELKDIAAMKTAFEYITHTSCDYTPANIYLWSDVYDTEIAFDENDLYIKCQFDNDIYFAFPFVKHHIRDAIENMKEYAMEHQLEFKMSIIEPKMFEIIERLFPNEYMILYERDSADYIYNTSDLANLSGKKYHGKKNHVNKFKKTYDNWKYERIDDNNSVDCIEMVKEWCIQNQCAKNKSKADEICVMINGIKYRDMLGLKGGLLRINDRVVAVTLGEKINDEMFVVHFEKAFSDVYGAYTMINQQFVVNELMEYKYVNREEDVGIEGLRKAKLSYHPAFMGQKGILSRNEDFHG